MPWSHFDYETQLKVIDKIHLASNEEANWKIANAMKAAANELELWCNNHTYGEEHGVIDDFVASGKMPPDTEAAKIINENKTSRKFFSLLFGILGAVVGALMINQFPELIIFVGAVVGSLVFSTIGFAITKKR